MDKQININDSTPSSSSSSSESSDSEDDAPLLKPPPDKKKRKYNDIDNEILNNIPNTKKEILERRRKRFKQPPQNNIPLITLEDLEKITPLIFKIPLRNEIPNSFNNFIPPESDKCNEVLDDKPIDYENWEYKILNRSIETIEDLIELGNLYDAEEKIRYNIDIKTLNNLVPPLIELKNMIGMKKVKRNIVDQIIYYLQGIDDKNNDMLHCVIEGPPGVGKTEVAKILGKIYKKLGILTSDKFKIVKRSDLIGGYLGQTAIKTQKVLDECNGGVLFIDEAYSLGNVEGKDSYSKECIDTLTAYLSENKRNFICIIAGYKEALKNCFFNMNEGLERRFPYRFEIDKYNPEELREIFFKIVKQYNWNYIENEIGISFFEKNQKYFIFNGGDMEILFHKCKISHSRRVFTLSNEFKKKLSLDDLEKGFKLYLQNDEISNRYNKDSYPNNMYI